MNEVISFRLDKTNPREARALEVWNAWIKKGFSTRHILTTALLELDHPGSDLGLSHSDRGLGLILEQIGQLLKFAEAVKTYPISQEEPVPEQANLNESFLTSIKQGIKPGFKLE